jgi:hypothetical protein
MTALRVPPIEQAIGREHERQRTRDALRRLLEQIDIDEQMRRRAVQQAILEAEAWYWEWRAEQFHWAGDLATAQACLNKAAFLRWDGEGGDLDVINVPQL